MNKLAKVAALTVALVMNAMVFSPAQAEELATVCWVTENQSRIRFSVTQTGPGHYIYTGIFNDGEDGETTTHYAVTGLVEVGPDGKLVGSFTGSKSTNESFKTVIASLQADPVTYAGQIELIRNKYDRMTQVTRPDYRMHTITRTACPN